MLWNISIKQCCWKCRNECFFLTHESFGDKLQIKQLHYNFRGQCSAKGEADFSIKEYERSFL